MDDVIRIGFLVSNKFVVISKQLIIVYVFVHVGNFDMYRMIVGYVLLLIKTSSGWC